MLTASAAQVSWLNSTAALAQRTASQARAAAAAFETARAACVPPEVVAANRVLLAQLAATDVLGQNIPAIAATEADYAAMWAQDAAAMYTYAANSAVATQLTTFRPPPQLASLAANPIGWFNGLLDGSNPYSGAFLGTWNAVASSIGPTASPASIMSLFTAFWAGATAATVLEGGANATATAPTLPPEFYPLPTVSATAGGATSSGGLSVPPSWWAAGRPTAPNIAVNPAAVSAPDDVPGLISPPVAMPSLRSELTAERPSDKWKYLNRPRMLPTQTH